MRPEAGAYDVVIVGAGVIGCALARELALRSKRVLVLERDAPISHASRGAAGMLSPQAEADEPGAFLELLRASRALFPALAAALREETGIDVGYRTEGTLLLALDDDQLAMMEQRHAWQAAAGLPVTRLSPAEARAREPGLTPDLVGALHFPDDHQVDTPLLGRALWFSAVAAGAEIRTGAEALRLVRERQAVVGVELRGGHRIGCDHVVLAGGSWSGELTGLPRPLPVRPIRGQLATLEAAPPAGIRHVLASAAGYLVPRHDGRVIVGATSDDVGFRRGVTVDGLLRLLFGARTMVPALGGSPLQATWSGFRPATPDLLPILGPDPAAPGLTHASGHYRNGILLAPVTARALADAICGDPPAVDLSPFRPDRF